MKYYLMAFRNYFQFKGRANRSEYWYFCLFNFLFVIAAVVLDNLFGLTFHSLPYGMIYIIYVLGAFIPALAVTVRRLHDINNSGWYFLVALIPVVGSIILLVVLAKKGTTGENKYGFDPNGEIIFDFETSEASGLL